MVAVSTILLMDIAHARIIGKVGGVLQTFLGLGGQYLWILPNSNNGISARLQTMLKA